MCSLLCRMAWRWHHVTKKVATISTPRIIHVVQWGGPKQWAYHQGNWTAQTLSLNICRQIYCAFYTRRFNSEESVLRLRNTNISKKNRTLGSTAAETSKLAYAIPVRHLPLNYTGCFAQGVPNSGRYIMTHFEWKSTCQLQHVSPILGVCDTLLLWFAVSMVAALWRQS
jgi:hypothetical protein